MRKVSPPSSPPASGVDSRPQPDDKLAKGRLVIALDALLSRRNVTLAAKDLGVQASAMSRILAYLREELGDPLFIRSGRGLVPTPFAEALRPRVRAVAAQLETLFERAAAGRPAEAPFDPRWNVSSPVEPPPLLFRPAHLLDGEPSPQDLSNKLDRIGMDAPAQRRLARHIGVLGVAGGGNGRPLTMEEAEDAMAIILAGEADPVQIGALFGMLRIRGSTAPELAGCVRAARAHVAARLGRKIRADLDWPCYTSPNCHNPPWFFHAARLLSHAGIKVVMHGSTGSGDTAERYRVIASALDIPVCATATEISAALAQDNIAYVPLATLAPQIYRLIGLHRLTETRSIALEAVHLLKPVETKTSLLGVAKPSYKELHRDTARMLGWKHLAVLGGTRDVAQFTPFRLTTVHRLVNGETEDLIVPALMREPPATPRPRGTSMEYWLGVWTGAIRDTRAEQVVVGTAAFAMLCIPDTGIRTFEDALEQAGELWKSRLAAKTGTRLETPGPTRKTRDRQWPPEYMPS
jgi:Anthranilate phosphoribosyltransferase